MMRVLRFSLGLLGCCSLPALALAQSGAAGSSAISGASTGSIPVQLYELDGKSYNERQPVPINKEQCEKNVEIVWRLSKLNTAAAVGGKYLQLWQGPNCNNASQRDGEAAGSDCDRVAVPEDWIITYGTDTQNYKMTVSGLCETDGDVPFYFLPVPNTSDVTDVAIFGQYTLKIDTEPPGAPGNVTVGKGETEIPIDWEPADKAIQSNWVVWDVKPVDGGDEGADGGASSGEGCSSSILQAGGEATLDQLREFDNIRLLERAGNLDHTEISAAELGADRVALAMLSTDIADNISKISNVECATVVPTKGFWDDYKAAGGTGEEGCACSAPGARGTQRGVGSALAPAALVLLAWGVRRRKRNGSRS